MPGTRAPRGRIRGAAAAIVGVLLGVLVGVTQPGAVLTAPGGSASTRVAADRSSGEPEPTPTAALRRVDGTHTSTNVADTETRAQHQSGRGGVTADLTNAPSAARPWRGATGSPSDASRGDVSGSASADVRAPPGPHAA